MNGDRSDGDRPQRVPRRVVVVTVVIVVVVLGGIVARWLMGGHLWPYPGSGPWPGL